VQQVGQNVARSHQWNTRTHGAPDPAVREVAVSGQSADTASAGTRIGETHQEALLWQSNIILAFAFGHAR
jgi:hypothetical protein